MNVSITPEPISIRDIAFICFKHFWAMLIIFTAIMAGVCFWLFFIKTDSYEVNAKILVKIGHEQSIPSTVVGKPGFITGERQNDVNSEADILQSSDLLIRVIDRYGLDKLQPKNERPTRFLALVRWEIRSVVDKVKKWKDELSVKIGLRERLDPREEVIDILQKALIVVPERDSNIIVAQMAVPYRKDSAQILNTLLDEYQKFRLEIYQDSGASGFFRQETERARRDLEQAELELQQFESGSDITAIEKQKEILLTQRAEAEGALMNAQISYDEMAAKVKRLDREMHSPEPNLAAVGAFTAGTSQDNLVQQLATLQREREEMRMTELDSDPRIRNNRDQFQVLAAMVASNLNSVLLEHENELAARKRILDTVNTKLTGLEDRSVRWRDLNRKVATLEDNYLGYQKKLDETAADRDLRTANLGSVVILQHAIDPVIAAGPRKSKLLGVALVLAIFAALAWTAIAEFFDHRVYTREALERRLDMPVIGVIPAGAPRYAIGTVVSQNLGSAASSGSD